MARKGQKKRVVVNMILKGFKRSSRRTETVVKWKDFRCYMDENEDKGWDLKTMKAKWRTIVLRTQKKKKKIDGRWHVAYYGGVVEAKVEEEGQEAGQEENIEAADTETFQETVKLHAAALAKVQTKLRDYFDSIAQPPAEEEAAIADEYIEDGLASNYGDDMDVTGIDDMEGCFAMSDDMMAKLEMMDMQDELDAKAFSAPADDRDKIILQQEFEKQRKALSDKTQNYYDEKKLDRENLVEYVTKAIFAGQTPDAEFAKMLQDSRQ